MTYQIESLKLVSKRDVGENQRLCRIIAKKGNIEGRQMESQGFILPQISLAAVNALLSDENGKEWFKTKLAEVQDGIVRRLIGAGKNAIFDEQIGVGAMLDAITAENEVTRFSKAAIEKWFNEYLLEAIGTRITEKYPQLDSKKLASMVAAYLENFQLLAGRNPTMPKAIKASLIRAMEFLPEEHDTVVAQEIATRLANVPEASSMLEIL